MEPNKKSKSSSDLFNDVDQDWWIFLIYLKKKPLECLKQLKILNVLTIWFSLFGIYEKREDLMILYKLRL